MQDNPRNISSSCLKANVHLSALTIDIQKVVMMKNQIPVQTPNTGRDLHSQILAQGGLEMSYTVVKKQAYILLNPSFHLGQNYRYEQQDFCYIAVRKTVFY